MLKIAMLGLSVHAFAFTAQGVIAGQDETQILEPGQLASRTLPPSEVDRFILRLEQGQFIRIKGEQSTGFSFLRLFEPGGNEPLLQRMNPVGPHLLSFQAQRSGDYLLEVVPLVDAESTTYNLSIDELISREEYRQRLDSLQGDPRVGWLRDNLIPLRSINPRDHDFSDLQGLKQAVGNARIVLLGEESHASGTTRLALSRLVEFFHSEMGFELLAWESGFFDVARAWKEIRGGARASEALQRGLHGTWGRSAELQPLMDYISQQANSDQPLIPAGIDVQYSITNAWSQEYLLKDLVSFLRSRGLDYEAIAPGSPAHEILQGVMEGAFWGDDAEVPSRMEERATRETLLSIRRRLDGEEGDPEARFWDRVLQNAANQTASALGYLRDEPFDSNWRDRRMAENLIWLAREHPDKKIVVWAANPHLMRNYHLIDDRLDTPYICDCSYNVGQAIWEEFGEESFVLTPTAYSGRFNWRAVAGEMPDWDIVVDQDSTFELEELVEAAGFENVLLPLRDTATRAAWLSEPILSRTPWNYWAMNARWPQHTDAILFLHTISPPRPVGWDGN
jgi:erythromycin esterase